MSLPKGFKRLEYIESTGTQCADTGVVGNQGIEFEVEFEIANSVSSSGQGTVLGCLSSTSARYEITTWTNNAYGGQFCFGTNIYDAGITQNVRMTMALRNGVLTTPRGTVSVSASAFDSGISIALFGRHRQNVGFDEFAKMKLYSCQIYDNGTLVRDYIPCQNASGTVGLWDAVNEVFYGNAGTGTFTAGPVVPEIVDESEITELEYIQSNGTQYADTGFCPSESSRISFDFQSTGSTSDSIKAMFGARLNNDTKCFDMFALPATAYPQYGANAYNAKPISVNILQRTVYEMNRNTATANGTSVSFAAETFDTGFSVYLFTLNDNGVADTRPISGRLYSCRIYDNGLLERDYIPAKLTNGEIGLYDRVFHEFYRNAGTGEFIAGPEAATTPKAPANFRVESEADTLVTLAWDASDKAVGYRLYRSGQLLADTEETSVSVAVEPFAGAVFTVTAYNENGEGAGAELTYFNAPDDPILFLVTDRTQQDVAEQNPKGYYAASDLNRVGYAMDYLANIIRGYGYTLEVHTKTDWTDEDWKLTGEMVKYLQSLNNLKAVFSTLVELPETMEKIDYRDANNIEQLLLTIDETIVRVVAGFTRANAYGLRSGAKGLPASQSDRGRNWGQLDAMETTWANWQLATWYLLLYGNLKAEGVVE